MGAPSCLLQQGSRPFHGNSQQKPQATLMHRREDARLRSAAFKANGGACVGRHPSRCRNSCGPDCVLASSAVVIARSEEISGLPFGRPSLPATRSGTPLLPSDVQRAGTAGVRGSESSWCLSQHFVLVDSRARPNVASKASTVEPAHTTARAITSKGLRAGVLLGLLSEHHGFRFSPFSGRPRVIPEPLRALFVWTVYCRQNVRRILPRVQAIAIADVARCGRIRFTLDVSTGRVGIAA